MCKLDETSAIGPSYVRSTLRMNAKAKIRLDSIEQAHRALDALPEHRPEELTKTQAIQRLIVPIRATQSKGYSLAAIGKVLSECGISITTGALRAYVSDAKADAGKKNKPGAKRFAKARKEAQPATEKGRQGVPPAQPARPASKPDDQEPARAVDLDGEPTPRPDKAAPSPAPARRHGLDVRPDTKDL
jgi:hypothetical protein